jgi:cell wall-associated NlpC family hydrolase
MKTRQDIIDAAKSWIGTPYHHRAQIKGAGVDCAQILVAVYSEAGFIEPFDTGGYPTDWMLHRSDEVYLNTICKYAHAVDIPLPGDIALFRFGRCVSHSAIVIAWPIVIHAYAQEECVCYGDGMSGFLKGRLAGFYSLIGGA